MPLTAKGATIKSAMEEQYGKERGEEVFYASKNAGTITGVDAMEKPESDDCADQSPHELGPEHPALQEALGIDDDMPPLVMPPDPPLDELEHPQKHPDGSTPPSSADNNLKRSTYGGIAGGINPYGAFGAPGVQVWGDTTQQHDQPMPSPMSEVRAPSVSLAEVQRYNAELWAHGVAPGPYRDKRRR